MTPETISPAQTRVLLAVVDGARTVRGVARACGINVSTAHTHLCHLRERRLVDWTPERSATLHALVVEVWP